MRVLRGVVYMTKSSGPRTEPWGTPQEEVCQEDRSVSQRTPAHLSAGKQQCGVNDVPALRPAETDWGEHCSRWCIVAKFQTLTS